MLRLTVEQTDQLNTASEQAKNTATKALQDLQTVKFMGKKVVAIDTVLDQIRQHNQETLALQSVTAKLSQALNSQQSGYQERTLQLVSLAQEQTQALNTSRESLNDIKSVLEQIHEQIPRQTDELSQLYETDHEHVNDMYQGLYQTLAVFNQTLRERGGREVQFAKLSNINQSLEAIADATPEREKILLQFYQIRSDRLAILNQEISALNQVIIAFTEYLKQLLPTVDHANDILNQTLQTILAYNPSTKHETSDILKLFEEYTGDNPEKIAQAQLSPVTTPSNAVQDETPHSIEHGHDDKSTSESSSESKLDNDSLTSYADQHAEKESNNIDPLAEFHKEHKNKTKGKKHFWNFWK